jgi:hypothetical protein
MGAGRRESPPANRLRHAEEAARRFAEHVPGWLGSPNKMTGGGLSITGRSAAEPPGDA